MTPVPVIHSGDCRDIIAVLAFSDGPFDACVTDPPYDLTSVVKRFGSPTAAPAQHGRDGAFARQSRGFMGKQWDGTGVAFDPATWRAVFDALKPGGYLVAFGATRTYHRMAVAIEDAGFEIRDCLMWLYGTGFPKSHDVSKAIDAHLGAERAVVGVNAAKAAKQTAKHGTSAYGEFGGNSGEITAPATAEAEAWEGWGTALKPAVEPIVLARKPLSVDGRPATVAANALAHGVGGLNIGGCRVPLPAGDALHAGITGRDGSALDTGDVDSAWGFKAVDRAPGLGRWPANLIHDGSADVLAAFPNAPEKLDGLSKTGNVYGAMKRGRRPGGFGNVGAEKGDSVPNGPMYNDTGSAARFFYSAKASKADRVCGDAPTKHPTVKPLALMRWLCRLVTPPGGLILDPFAGSGTTLQAAHEEGFAAVGCEMDAEYVADIRRRLARLTLASSVSHEDTPDDSLAGFLA